MFTIDTLVFSFGYAFEFKCLKNVVKSVEPTFFGWFVAIICYPPIITWPFTLGMLFWTVIYFFRAITEERHLRQDPDYIKY